MPVNQEQPREAEPELSLRDVLEHVFQPLALQQHEISDRVSRLETRTDQLESVISTLLPKLDQLMDLLTTALSSARFIKWSAAIVGALVTIHHYW